MIRLIHRGGSGGHTVSALLDFCTEEGNLDGYPNFIAGNNLHTHSSNHLKLKKKFYEPGLHYDSDEILWKKVNGIYINDSSGLNVYPDDLTNILAPTATDNPGRILTLTMSFGKCKNKKLPPNDDFIDYSTCSNLSEKLEKIILVIADVLKQSFKEFHGHRYPDHIIDVMWFYNNDYQKISDIIADCGWTPKIKKIKKFCNLILKFNKPYYDILTNSMQVYDNIIDKQIIPCTLTFYETAVICALLINHYDIRETSQMKLINELPTSTEEFFNLYDIT